MNKDMKKILYGLWADRWVQYCTTILEFLNMIYENELGDRNYERIY
jgi:hypothetical protein